eukprot:5797704-Pyramimonas_sp.AAC.1
MAAEVPALMDRDSADEAPLMKRPAAAARRVPMRRPAAAAAAEASCSPVMGPSSDSETGAQALAAGQKVKEDTRDDDSVQPSKRPRRAKGQGQAKATAAKAGAKASPPKLEASKEEPPDTVPGEGQSALAAPVDSAASAQDETPSQEEEDSG